MIDHLITREIGIDAGHRVTYHGSKCRNIHGHRYTIQATCRGPLYEEGEQQGMVLDFGFLKEEMMRFIDGPCDHGMILWWEDPLLEMFSGLARSELTRLACEFDAFEMDGVTGKLYAVPFVPTAENLAHHWFKLLVPRVAARTKSQAVLHQIKVWETPNCSATFPVRL